MHEMIDLEGNATTNFIFNSIFIRNYGNFYTHNGRNERIIQGKYLQVSLKENIVLFLNLLDQYICCMIYRHKLLIRKKHCVKMHHWNC